MQVEDSRQRLPCVIMRERTGVSGPVFVDASGRRQRRLRLGGSILGCLCGLYLGLVGLSLLLAPGVLSVSVPGMGALLPGPHAPQMPYGLGRPAKAGVVLGTAPVARAQASASAVAALAGQLGSPAGRGASANVALVAPRPAAALPAAQPAPAASPSAPVVARRLILTPTPAVTPTKATGKPTSRPSSPGQQQQHPHPHPHRTGRP